MLIGEVCVGKSECFVSGIGGLLGVEIAAMGKWGSRERGVYRGSLRREKCVFCEWLNGDFSLPNEYFFWRIKGGEWYVLWVINGKNGCVK